MASVEGRLSGSTLPMSIAKGCWLVPEARIRPQRVVIQFPTFNGGSDLNCEDKNQPTTTEDSDAGSAAAGDFWSCTPGPPGLQSRSAPGV